MTSIWKHLFRIQEPALLILITFLVFPLSVASAESLYSASKKGKEAFDSGEYEKSLDFYTRAQLEAPENQTVFFNLGNAQYKNKDYEAALGSYLKALNGEDEALKQKAHYNIGNTWFRQGKYDEAIKSYTKALEMNPEDTRAKENIEFTKKVREMQKQQQQNQDQDKNNENKDEQQDKEKGQQNQSQQSENKKEENKKKGTDPEENKEENAEKNTPPEPEKEDDGKEPEKQAAQQQKAADEKEGEEKRKQAERLLNRLQDTPGKALMPAYDQRKVEKDW